jgi:CrcB protein
VLQIAPAATRFPWPVLAVNVAGCLLVGVLLAIAEDARTPDARSALLRDVGAIGFCGGFTTFSTFAVEVARLLDDGRTATATAYVAGSVALGVAAVVAGAAAARRGRGGPPLVGPS